jgi:hypothetical protein
MYRFFLVLEGGTCLFFGSSLGLLVGLGFLTGGIEEVRTVSPRLVLARTFSGDTLSVGMIHPSDFTPVDLVLPRLPVLPFSLKAYRDM